MNASPNFRYYAALFLILLLALMLRVQARPTAAGWPTVTELPARTNPAAIAPVR